ncbi:MAG TPA: hypothetical protein VJ841_01880 [Candidatus Saccharimonadales bacterium]|nr:hypothetical protein [Candidatus Saccharimonadales bacterium]
MKSRHAFLPEQILTTAGLSIIVAGCVSSIFDSIVNQRFITRPWMILFYIPYLILLGGGFTAGYFLSRRNVFTGVIYAFLAVGLYFPLDSIRATLGDFVLSGFLFTTLPAIVLLIICSIAFATQYRKRLDTPSMISKFLLGFSFGAYALTQLVLTISAGSRYALVSPVVIAIITYFILKIRNPFDRIVYAILMSELYILLVIILSKFQTNPVASVANSYTKIIVGVSLVATLALAFYIRNRQKIS